jgi:hypothetical protein
MWAQPMYSQRSTAQKWSIQEPTFRSAYFIAFVHRTQTIFLMYCRNILYAYVYICFFTTIQMYGYSFCKMLTILAKHRKPYFISLYIENFLWALLSTFLYTGQYSQNIICYSDAQAMKFKIPLSTCCMTLERNFLPFWLILQIRAHRKSVLCLTSISTWHTNFAAIWLMLKSLVSK